MSKQYVVLCCIMKVSINEKYKYKMCVNQIKQIYVILMSGNKIIKVIIVYLNNIYLSKIVYNNTLIYMIYMIYVFDILYYILVWLIQFNQTSKEQCNCQSKIQFMVWLAISLHTLL